VDHGPVGVGIAESHDLRTWELAGRLHPGVLTGDDGRTYLFFQGNDTGGRTNLLAGAELVWTDGRPALTARPGTRR